MLAAAPASGAEFYVSPTGDDANPGTKDRPFATLARARDTVRQVKAGATAPVRVWIRRGTYRLTDPVVFGPQDSGTQAAPIVYAACPGAKPVFSGARPITGWKRGPDGVWTAEIPEVKAGEWYFRQLFVNGQRRPRARLPRKGTYKIAGPAEPRKWAFKFNPGQIDPNWRNLNDVEVIVLQFWTEGRLRIKSIDQAAHTVKFTGQAFRPLDWNKGWYVENVYEGLTDPGEWYLDRTTGVLSYRPLPGEKVDQFEIVAPVARHWLRLEGDYKRGKLVEHLTFRGLTFHYTSWTLDEKLGYSYPQAAIELTPKKLLWAGHPAEGLSVSQSHFEVPAGIYANGAHHVRFEDGEFAHTGAWAIDLSRGCQDNQIVGNHIHDLGAGAVRVGSPDVTFDDAEESCRNAITDNHIHDGDTVYLGAPAVWIGQSSGNRIAHNEIHGPFEWAVSVGWNWGYMPPNRARDNVVEYNHVHHLGASALGTHGALYFLGIQPGTAARYNHVHHIAGGGSGIVLDNGSVGMVVEYNVVHHCQYASLMCNHNDLGNIIQNNVFALSDQMQVHRIGDLPRDHEMVDQTGVLYRNIFYWRDSKLFKRDSWPKYDMIMDYNLFFDATPGGETRFQTFTFEQWKQKKMDVHSIVADPCFVDPGKDDFALKPESPAFKLGFRPIDLSTVGPRPRQRPAGTK